MILASSNYDYKEFDQKTVEFLDEGLELIEEDFKGIQTANVEVTENKKKEKIEFPYFPSVEAENKEYFKVLIPVKDVVNEDQWYEPSLRKEKEVEEKKELLESEESENSEEVKEELPTFDLGKESESDKEVQEKEEETLKDGRINIDMS